MNISNLISQYWLSAVFAFGLGLILTFFALWFYPKVGLMDRPVKYGLSRKPIPYYGGLMVYLAFLISVLLFVPMSRELVGVLLGATLVMAVGFLDDLFDLSPLIRMIFQVIAALILVFSGIGILSINFPFIGTLEFDLWMVNGIYVLSALFTVFWVVVILNTINFVDGVSGLVSGVSFIAGITMFILSIHPGVHENPESQVGIATIALIVAMISFAFLIFDFPKPKILMGDSGSTLLGFLIATLAIFSGGKVATAFLVLGLPILDMIWVVLRRLIKKQKIWKGDLKHLHHRLIDIGFSRQQVVILYLFVTAVFGLLAVSLVSAQQKLFILIGLVVLMLLLASALVFLPKKR